MQTLHDYVESLDEWSELNEDRPGLIDQANLNF